jgi:hypothetical protein
MRILEELKTLPSDELEKILTKLIKEDKTKAIALSKAIGKALEEEIKEEKLKTETAVAQSRIYTLTRDVEEVAILEEGVKKAFGENFYTNPLESKRIKEIARKFGVDEKKLAQDLYSLLEPFPTTEALDWVFKMLKNQTVVIKNENEIVEELPIAVTKPVVVKDENSETQTSFIGIFISENKKKKAHFIPVVTVALTYNPSIDKDFEVWIEGERVDNKSLKELSEIEFPHKEIDLPEHLNDYAKEIREEILGKVIDKYVFFHRTISSSRLNEKLRRFFKNYGFFTPRKNQSVFVADREEDEARFFAQVSYFRSVVKGLKEAYQESKEIIKEMKKEGHLFPSLAKQPYLSRQILIEEVALISKEQIMEELRERFKIGLEQLKEAIRQDKELKTLKNQDWFKELELIPEKVYVDRSLIEEYNKLKRILEEKEVYNSVMKQLNWEKPNIKRFDKALRILETTEFGMEQLNPNLKLALSQLIKESKTVNQITELASVVMKHKERIMFLDAKEELTLLAQKAYALNPTLGKKFGETFGIDEKKYKIPQKKAKRKLF